MKISTTRKNIQIVRPLLNYKKKEIITFNENCKIKFLQDPSNLDENYTRVKIRNFLISTKKLQLIIKDFNKVNYYVPYYQLMINEILNKIILRLKKNLITISLNDFNKLNLEIKAKLIDKIYVFFYQNNKRLRFVKVMNFLNKLNNSSFKNYNLSSMSIKKTGKFLDFSIIN